MKMVVVLLAALLLVSSQVSAELSVSDLDKIREIVKESETRMKENMTDSETRIKEYVTSEIENMNTKIEEMDRRLTSEIKAVDTQVGRNFYLILGFVALIVFAVGLPQIITASQGRKLQEYSIILEDLKQEIELLKQERSV